MLISTSVVESVPFLRCGTPEMTRISIFRGKISIVFRYSTPKITRINIFRGRIRMNRYVEWRKITRDEKVNKNHYVKLYKMMIREIILHTY
ncbi:hypothetical protein DXA98_06695 [Lachnospiraceae bacterium OF09-6]|nr:hypothetical protein DXA98_06695 [Lachnospiraceae bacterium OF09-6]